MTFEIDSAMEAQLNALAAQSGKPADSLVREAILEYLETLKDTALAEKLLAQPERVWSMEEVERDLGLDD